METVMDYTHKEKSPPTTPICVKTREAFTGNPTRCSWMPVRKSDLLRAGCCSGKPRLHGRTKGPSSVPRIRALHDAKSGGRKAGGGIGCPRGTGELPHWTSRSRLESLESVRYDSATWGQIPNKEGPPRVRGANLPPQRSVTSRTRPGLKAKTLNIKSFLCHPCKE